MFVWVVESTLGHVCIFLFFFFVFAEKDVISQMNESVINHGV